MLFGPSTWRERTIVADECRLCVQLEFAVDQFDGCQQFDGVAEFVGVFEVGQFDRVDPLHGELLGIDLCAEGEQGQQAEFLSRIGPLHIH